MQKSLFLRDYDPFEGQTIRRIPLTLTPPSMDDQTDDWSRLQTAIRREAGVSDLRASLEMMRELGTILREGELASDCNRSIPKPGIVPIARRHCSDLQPGHVPADAPLWGAAIDIGTTTVSVWLVDLLTGKVRAQVAEYNQQISRGEDVISRIIVAGKEGGQEMMQNLVLGTINELLERACKRVQAQASEVVKVTDCRKQHHDAPAAGYPRDQHPADPLCHCH